MIKLLCAILLLTSCKDEGLARLIHGEPWFRPQPVDAEVILSPELQATLQAVKDRLDKCSKLAADTTAEYLKHLRTDHFEKENPPEEGFFPSWPFEWPDRWVKVEFVCPTAKYSNRCRTTDWFHDHPEAITSNGKMK